MGSPDPKQPPAIAAPSTLENLYSDPDLFSPSTPAWEVSDENLGPTFTSVQETISDLRQTFKRQKGDLERAIDGVVLNPAVETALDEWPGEYDRLLWQIRDFLTNMTQSWVFEMHARELWHELRRRDPGSELLVTHFESPSFNINPVGSGELKMVQLPLMKMLRIPEKYVSLHPAPTEPSFLESTFQSLRRSSRDRSRSRDPTSGEDDPQEPSHLGLRGQPKKSVEKRIATLQSALEADWASTRRNEKAKRIREFYKRVDKLGPLAADSTSQELLSDYTDRMTDCKAILMRSVTQHMRRLTIAQLNVELHSRKKSWRDAETILGQYRRDLEQMGSDLYFITSDLTCSYERMRPRLSDSK